MKKKILNIVAAIALVMIMAVGCSAKEEVIKDREGRDITLPSKIDKIISTAPSNTEVIVALGLADKLIAVDKYSADVEGIPNDIEFIDFSNPDAEAIVELNPDIIIASGHNKTGSTEDPFKLVEEAGISVAYIPSSDSIQGIYDDIMFISKVTNTEEQGKTIVSDMKTKVEDIAEKAKTINEKKKVYFEIGPAPNLYSFGNSTFLNEMIELIGAENILKDETAWISPSAEKKVYFEIGPAPNLYSFGNSTFLNEMIELIGAENILKDETAWISPSAEIIIDKNPDVIITNVGYIDNPTDEIKSREGWENINAIKNNEVYQVDKNSSSRPSQNIITALNEMSEAIYPHVYSK